MKKNLKFIEINEFKAPYDDFSQKISENLCLNSQKKIKILNTLGHGSFGIVCEMSYNITPNKTYAIKIIPIKKNKGKESIYESNTKQELNLSRNLYNINIIKSLNATNFQYQIEKNKIFSIFAIIMEKARYRDLSIFISHFQKYNILRLTINNRKFPYIKLMSEYTMKFFINQIVKGLFFLYTNNLIHGDIKPGNILIGDNYTLKLCDFSLTKSIAKHQNKIRISSGTDEFSPIECFDNEVSYLNAGKNDIFALGCISYLMQFEENLISKKKCLKYDKNECKNQINQGIEKIEKKIEENREMKKNSKDNFYSNDSLYFTQNLIQLDADKRFGHKDVIENEWLNRDKKEIKKIVDLNETEKGIKLFIEFQKSSVLDDNKTKKKRKKFFFQF